jgi:hypothetical protein
VRLSFEEAGSGTPILFVHEFAAGLPTNRTGKPGPADALCLAQTPQHHWLGTVIRHRIFRYRIGPAATGTSATMRSQSSIISGSRPRIGQPPALAEMICR